MNKSDTLDIVRETLEKREKFSKSALKGFLDNPQAANFIGNLLNQRLGPLYNSMPLHLMSMVEQGILSDLGGVFSNMFFAYEKPLKEALFRSITFLMNSGVSYQEIKQESEKFRLSEKKKTLNFFYSIFKNSPSWKIETLIKSSMLKKDLLNCPAEKIPATSGTSENELKLKYSGFVLRPSGFCLKYSEYLNLREKIQKDVGIENFDPGFQISITNLHQTLFFLFLFFAEKNYLPFKDKSIVTSTANFGKIVVVKIKNGKLITVYDLKAEKKEDLLFKDNDVVIPLITF